MFANRIFTSATFTGALATAVVCASGVSAQDPVAQFYRGQQIKMIIGGASGGGYDTYARLLARHLGKHIPGNPTIIPQNMDGAGGIIAANFMVNVAPHDGTVIGALQREAALVQMMGQQGPQFKAEELNWIGSLASEAGVCAVATRTGVNSFGDVFTRTFAMGSTGPNTTEFHPALLNNLLGARFKLIKGYPGTPHIHLAIQRGELDGVCQSWASLKELAQDFMSNGGLKPLVQVSLQPDPEMQNLSVPMLEQFITPDRVAKGRDVEEVKTLFRLTLVPNVMGRPYAMAPGVPADRAKAVRGALYATTKDPAFIAEAEKMHRDIEYVSGEDIQRMVAELAKTPKESLVALDELMKFKGPTQEAKVELLRHTGKVLESKDEGRTVVIDYKGKKTAAEISGSRTKVMIDGEKAKRGNVAPGMTCTVAYYGPGTQAEELDCKK